MPDSLDLERALVIGVASSALFDLSESDAVFRNEGEEKYRAYQRENLDEILEPGVAFPFIRRLLDLNDLSEDERLVEVVILSRNGNARHAIGPAPRAGHYARNLHAGARAVPVYGAAAHVPVPLSQRG